MARIDHFECSQCGERVSGDAAPTVCPRDGGLLHVRYDLKAICGNAQRPSPNEASRGVWRYSAVLPDVESVTLGEGQTPLLRARKYPNLFIKDEGLNPTGSCEARGISVAVSMARHHGRQGVTICSGGDDAAAAAAYAAAAGLKAHVLLPKNTPVSTRAAIEAFGAKTTLMDSEVGDHRDASGAQHGDEWVDLSASKDPFRVEGLKTIGYEIAEALGWRLPRAVLCTNGDGLLSLAIEKAFAEMRELRWVEAGASPQIIGICVITKPPNYKVIHEVRSAPETPGEYILQISEAAMMSGVKEMASSEGVFASPEGGAAWAAYKSLLNTGVFKGSDEVVVINPASGYEYLNLLGADVPSPRELKLPASRNIGGIIGPY